MKNLLRPTLVFSAGQAVVGQAKEELRLDETQAAQFRTAIMPHLDSAYNFARYLVRDPASAEDIVQDAFLRAFRALRCRSVPF